MPEAIGGVLPVGEWEDGTTWEKGIMSQPFRIKSHGINANVRFRAAEKGQMFAGRRPFGPLAFAWKFAIF